MNLPAITSSFDFSKTLYRCVFSPATMPRATEADSVIIEKKVLQIRNICNLLPKTRDVDSESEDYRIITQASFVLIAIKAKYQDFSTITNQEEYRNLLTDLVESYCNRKSGLLYALLRANNKPFGVVNYVKECPDLFLNDLICGIIESDFILKDKLEVLNEVLNCYQIYIKRLVELYNTNPDWNEVNETSAPELRILKIIQECTKEQPIKKLALEKLESLLQSYKEGLSHLFKLSAEYTWKECSNQLSFAFYETYRMEYFNVLFKFISLIPESNLKTRLCKTVINYLVFMQVNRYGNEWISYVYLCHMLSLIGLDKIMSGISNPYLSAITKTGFYMNIIAFMFSSITNCNENQLNEVVKWSNKIYPFLFWSSVLINIYAFSQFVLG